MAGTTLQAQIDAASAYEALMVPSLFGPWASTVADAARIRSVEKILHVACGTGILAREVLTRTGAAGLVAGLDPSPGMLEVARRLAPGAAETVSEVLLGDIEVILAPGQPPGKHVLSRVFNSWGSRGMAAVLQQLAKG